MPMIPNPPYDPMPDTGNGREPSPGYPDPDLVSEPDSRNPPRSSTVAAAHAWVEEAPRPRAGSGPDTADRSSLPPAATSKRAADPARRDASRPHKRKKEPDSRSNWWLLALILAILCLLLFLLDQCGVRFPQDASTPPDVTSAVMDSATGIRYDANAVSGGWETADPDAIRDELNSQVEAGMICITANPAPYFRDGASDGNLMIVNDASNRYPQSVEIFRDDTGERVYASDAIPVGCKIERAKLDVPLDTGVYHCTAYFYNLDPSSGAKLGCAGAVIELHVGT